MAPQKPATSSTVVKHVPQKLRRNERERKRVDQVNQGFIRLRDRVPKQPGCKQKMSKVETLREAARYIQLLQSQLGIMTCASSSIDFPTPEHSPNYLPPHTPQMSSGGNQCHVANYDYNNMSPFYPLPNHNGPMSNQYSTSSASSTTTVSSNGGVEHTTSGTTPAQFSPGSNSFYSDTSYDEYLH